MFERRLRLFLLFIFLGAFLLAMRAAQVQVLQRGDWVARAESDAERPTFIPARRGDLLDFKGEVIATDVPSFEASVNYRAITEEPDAKWLKDEATRRARKHAEWTTADADTRLLMIAEEQQGIRNDLHEMWTLLANISGKTSVDIEAARKEIIARVTERKAQYVRRQYADAMKAFDESPKAAWYVRLVAGTPRAPDVAAIEKKVIRDQVSFHAVLTELTQSQYNALALAQDRLPQYKPSGGAGLTSILQLAPTVKRRYPFGDVAAHVIGRVAAVSAEDLERDPNKDDELKRYGFNDRIGREGLEKMAEQQLRGSRGTKFADRRGNALRADTADAGESVQSSIDIKLQRDVQEAFKQVDFLTPEKNANDDKIIDVLSMNGAAVVIDIKTGQVRALVSVPTFDLNKFDELYPALSEDELNRPMINRALMDALEPGSTVKPIVGLAAVTQKYIGADEAIECTGHPIIDGRRLEKPRCWTMSMYGAQQLGARHVVPSRAPHPTGRLTLTDAIERSCNVYFVTKGDELGIQGLSYWMQQFGLGRRTGIGLPEARGLVPSLAKIDPTESESAKWYASIGQGPVNATPIQIANEMATIARNGVWQRPTLLVNPLPKSPSTQPADPDAIPDRYDLKLDPAALRAVRTGMDRVVNSAAGTGTQVHRTDVRIAAKTGSATANPLGFYVKDADGRQLYDEAGDPVYQTVPYGSHAEPNPDLPWYRMSGVDDKGKRKGTHSWIAGFAPADNPQIAFAVYVEYGSSGGVGAGSVATKLIDSCIRQGYITPTVPGAARPNVPASIARPGVATDAND